MTGKTRQEHEGKGIDQFIQHEEETPLCYGSISYLP